MAANLLFHRNHPRRRWPGESLCGSQRRSRIDPAVDPAHRARRHRGAGRTRANSPPRSALHPGNQRVVVRSIVDQHAPKLPIVWESPLEIPVFSVPKDASVRRGRTLGPCAGYGGFASRHGRGAMDRRAARQRRIRTVSLSAAGSERSGHEAALSERSACGLSSMAPTARASISITSPTAGAKPASARCTSPAGITTSRTPSPTNTCAG